MLIDTHCHLDLYDNISDVVNKITRGTSLEDFVKLMASTNISEEVF